MGVTVWDGSLVTLPANLYIVSERFTATAGQTIFNLSLFQYTTGGNSIRVFVNGLLQYLTTHYTETDSDTITFTDGLLDGDDVLVLGSNFVSTSDAALRGDLASSDGGRLVSFAYLVTEPSYANDAAAAAGGVAVGEIYRNGSAIQIRLV